MALSLQYWANYTHGKTKLQRKSEDAVNSDHVLRFLYDRETSHIEANVQASMRDRSYKVEIDLNDAYGIQFTRCECSMGDFACHHVAAALLFGYKRVSKTDVKCSWLNKPKSKRKHEVLTMTELFPHRKQGYRALRREVTDADRKFLYEELCKLGRFTALRWILEPEPAEVPVIVPVVEDIILSTSYITADCKHTYLRRALTLPPGTNTTIAEKTHGQRLNPLWSVVRKHRITASNFGVVLGAIKRNSYTASLQKRLLSAYNLDNVRSISWGITHESVAIEAYTKLGGQVVETGIWLHEDGVLGASPDGIITKAVASSLVHLQTPEARHTTADVLEVKCPYSARDISIRQAIGSIKTFFLTNSDDHIQLNINHDYYHQIQGQLHIIGKQCCDLLVWTPNDTVIIRIPKDITWTHNLTKLTEFYFHKYIPSILT